MVSVAFRLSLYLYGWVFPLSLLLTEVLIMCEYVQDRRAANIPMCNSRT